MNKIAMVIEGLHRSENALIRDLLAMSDWHKSDHEIFHLARDLAGWSKEHVAELARWDATTASIWTPKPDRNQACCPPRNARPPS